jgi:drug/metabolite transporter (DMT)-like permease
VALSGNLKGALLVLFAGMLFMAESVFVRWLRDDLPISVITFIRCLAQLAFVAPLFWRRGLAVARTDRLGMHLVRGALSLASWSGYYYAFAWMPFALATVFNFTSAIFVTMLAPLVLGERVGWRRWSATLVGFLGIVTIARPGALPLDWAVAAALVSALAASGTVLSTKRLSQTERTDTIMFWIGVVTTLGMLGPALWWWQWPRGEAWLWIFLMAAVGPAAMWLSVNALRISEASALVPFGYIRLIYALAIGWLLFGEWPEVWSFVGMVLIVGSAIYIAHREFVRAREAPAPT